MPDKETPEKRILVLDATLLSAIQSCPWYYYISFVLNKRINKPQEHFERGDLIHTVLERYYVCLKEGLSRKESRSEAIEAGRDKYTRLNLDIQDSEWSLQSFSQYEEHWNTDGMKVLEVEKPFMYKVFEDDVLIVYMTGKIDLYAELPIIGAVPIDHKSRERKNDEINLTNQYINYAIAKGSDVIYINEFGLQKTLKPEEKFRRIPLSYNNDLKAHWLRNTIQWAKRLDWHLQENNWPEIWNPFAKCKNCAVRTVCESGSMAEKERKLRTMFIDVAPWDVSKVLEGEKV